MVLEVDGVPDAPKEGVAHRAVRQDQFALQALNHCRLVCAGSFEIDTAAGIRYADTHVGVAKLGPLTRAADTSTSIRPTFLIFTLGLALRFVAKPVLCAAREASGAIPAYATTAVGAAILPETWGKGVTDREALTFLVARFAVLTKTADGATSV